MTSSRRYLKRIWRVPKDRGPVEYFGTLVLKALRKHGWPAELEVHTCDGVGMFQIVHDQAGLDAPADFWEAVSIAVRIQARIYSVVVSEHWGAVILERPYCVTERGQFREMS